MALQSEIPVTVFVPPYSPDINLEVWAQAVAGFCNGGQAVKQNNGIRSVRIGNLVHVQVEVTVEGTLGLIDVLPVLPRTNGFLNTYDADGNMKGIRYTTDSKQVDFTGFADGTYYVTGSYIATLKERI